MHFPIFFSILLSEHGVALGGSPIPLAFFFTFSLASVFGSIRELTNFAPLFVLDFDSSGLAR